MIDLYDDKYFMRRAIEEAKIALQKDEVPVGAVIVCDNQIIARTCLLYTSDAADE